MAEPTNTELLQAITALRTDLTAVRGDVTAVRSEMATKADLEAVRGEVAALREHVDKRIDALGESMERNFDAAAADSAAIRARVDGVHGHIVTESQQRAFLDRRVAHDIEALKQRVTTLERKVG